MDSKNIARTRDLGFIKMNIHSSILFFLFVFFVLKLESANDMQMVVLPREHCVSV